MVYRPIGSVAAAYGDRRCAIRSRGHDGSIFCGQSEDEASSWVKCLAGGGRRGLGECGSEMFDKTPLLGGRCLEEHGIDEANLEIEGQQ